MKMEDTQLLIISEDEYNELIDRSILLDFLEAEGVDNWPGWDYAWQKLRYYQEHGNTDDFEPGYL